MIEAINLVKEYTNESGKILALDGVNLRVLPGERIGVLGKNGSGKSTLIRLIGGVELPTSGKVTRSMSVSWPLAFRGGFNVHLSGYDNLRFLSRIYDKPFAPLAAFVEDFCELGRRMKDPIENYSSGMRAKLSLGLSLAIEFDCYLVDEVFAVGDERFRRKCREELFEKRRDRALLMVSHQTQLIQSACDYGILIENGRHVDTFDIKSDRNWRRHTAAN
jgi:capsular polysaccharide transport system ATP-binding protein